MTRATLIVNQQQYEKKRNFLRLLGYSPSPPSLILSLSFALSLSNANSNGMNRKQPKHIQCEAHNIMHNKRHAAYGTRRERPPAEAKARGPFVKTKHGGPLWESGCSALPLTLQRTSKRELCLKRVQHQWMGGHGASFPIFPSSPNRSLSSCPVRVCGSLLPHSPSSSRLVPLSEEKRR